MNGNGVKTDPKNKWIRGCMKKHVKESGGDGTMTKDQCLAAAYEKFGGGEK